jgi:hypothetical protein
VTANCRVTVGLPAVVAAVTIVSLFDRPVLAATPLTVNVVSPALPDVGDTLHHDAFAMIFLF